jgi:hypothetical protein
MKTLLQAGHENAALVAFPILIETNGITVDISIDHDTLPNLKFVFSILPATLFCLSRFMRPRYIKWRNPFEARHVRTPVVSVELRRHRTRPGYANPTRLAIEHTIDKVLVPVCGITALALGVSG